MSRLYTTFALAHASEGESSPDQAQGYWGIVTKRDGGWYQRIALEWYPKDLPYDASGRVAQNAWAFLPGYPLLARSVMTLTGLGFPPAATVISVCCATIAVVLLYQLVHCTGGAAMAFVAAVAISFFPTTAVLQLAYAESLELLLVVIALVLLRRRAYTWLPLVALALAVTRQVMPALALTIILHLIVRWLRRQDESVTRREIVTLSLTAAFSAVLTALWPIVAALTTGVPDAYLSTYSAWTRDGSPIGLKSSWIGNAIWGDLALLTALIAAYILMAVFRPWAWTVGAEVRAWSLSYGMYILFITMPGPSVARYLMLVLAALPPLPLVPDPQHPSQWRPFYWLACALVFAASLVAQWVWVASTLGQPLNPHVFP